MHRDYHKQAGSAIVAVLLVVAVISIIAVGLMVQQRIDIRRTQQIQTANQAYRYSQAVLYWAAGEIVASQNSPAPPEGELWQKDFPITTMANHRGQSSGHLERLDTRININSFSDQSSTMAQQNLATMVSNKSSDLSAVELTQVTKNIADWITANAATSDSYYLSLSPPYRAAHMPMVSPSELRLVVGVDAKVYQVLLPYIITLPTTQAKNPGFYLLQADVVLDDQNLRVYSILNLDNNVVKVLWSTLGTW